MPIKVLQNVQSVTLPTPQAQSPLQMVLTDTSVMPPVTAESTNGTAKVSTLHGQMVMQLGNSKCFLLRVKLKKNSGALVISDS